MTTKIKFAPRVRKDMTAADVHVSTALGNEPGKRKARSFLSVIGDINGAKVVALPDGDVGKSLAFEVDSVRSSVSGKAIAFEDMLRLAPSAYASQGRGYFEFDPRPVGKKDKGKTVTVYMVRHGATKMNHQTDMSQDRIRSWNDVPLTEEGREDAEDAAKKLKKLDIGMIVSSDLGRAKETAGIVGKALGITPIATQKMRPWNLGKFTGMTTEKANPGIRKYLEDKPDEPVPEGESFNDFRDRAFEGLRWAIKKAGKKNLAVISHHRNERLFESWDKLDQPADRSIDTKEYLKTGTDPGDVVKFDIDVDALAGKTVKKQLKEMEGTGGKFAHSPFPHDPNFLGKIPPDKVQRFMGALTNPERGDIKTMRLNGLVAMQDRVEPGKVASMRENEPDQPPLVVRTGGRRVIADGHHRLAALSERGRKTATVRVIDLDAEAQPEPQSKRDDGDSWQSAFTVSKVDSKQMKVFGWISVTQIGDDVVIDKQGDIIPDDELEKAIHDYMLYHRDQGDMHERVGVGRCCEMTVFNQERWDLGLRAYADPETCTIKQFGAFGGFKVDDPGVWKRIQEGKLPEFSIGGRAMREDA